MLTFIGPHGKLIDQIVDAFPGLDMRPLQNDGYVQLVRIVLEETTDAPGDHRGSPLFRYVLTAQGAAEVGIDPALLR